MIVGTGDDHAGAVGAGALEPGVTVDVTGTAEPVAVPSREPVVDEQRLLETHAHAVDGMLLVENPGFVSGGSTRWWAATQRIAQSELFALAAHAPPGSDGALFLPTLSGSMAPRWNGRMRGSFAGLALSHDALAPRARGARGLRVRAARHRRPLRGARTSPATRSASSAAARAPRCGCRSRPT